MSTQDETPSAAPLSREEVIAIVAKAHLGSASADSQLAASTLAAHSRLPKRVAENLGSGLGQWDFFPEISEIVDFALAYEAPTTEDDLWKLARTWAADDAARRKTMLTLVGRDILDLELRRIEVPKLRELIDEGRPARARELREALGLDVPAAPRAKAAAKRAPAEPGAPAAAKAPKAAAPGGAPAMMKMPKPERKPRPAPPPPPDAKRYQHPKFGAGVLLAQNGTGPEAKLTIRFESGEKTLQAQYVTEVPPGQ